MMKKGFVAIGLLLLTGSLWAQQDSLTAEEAVALALRNNYNIMLARQDSAVAAINYAYRNAAFLPRVNAAGTALFSNNNQKQTLADGSEKNRSGIRSNNLSGSINLNWTVFDGLRMFLLRDQIDIAVNQG
ncbi:MAG TPA: TolC family protein, partial [Flavisolibacter sp.]|nr:TolC family protein [Flavisolibacter sp.]